MSYPNGKLPASYVTTVAPGFILRKTTALAYRNLVKAEALLLNTEVTPVDNYGCGYRDIPTMEMFYRASQGDPVAKARCNIDPGMTISVAAPPNSSHAQATRADILFNRRTANGNDLIVAGWFGWSREFSTRDSNHFAHDGKTFGVPEHVKVRIVADYLNGRKLGRHTTADHDGEPGENFIWLLQAAGRADGIYPKPYLIDGDWNPTAKTRTHTVLYPHYWKLLWNG